MFNSLVVSEMRGQSAIRCVRTGEAVASIPIRKLVYVSTLADAFNTGETILPVAIESVFCCRLRNSNRTIA